MRLTARDEELLRKLVRCKWLTTSQIQRIFFSSASLDFVRKRLRKLGRAGYLRSYRENRMAEMLHGLGKPPKQIEHLVGVNDIRLAAEEGGVEFFYAHWELPAFGWEYPVFPDAVYKSRGILYVAEYDTGTETFAQLEAKFRQYACFDFDHVLLLYAETEKRLQKLKALAAETGDVVAIPMSEIRRHQNSVSQAVNLEKSLEQTAQRSPWS